MSANPYIRSIGKIRNHLAISAARLFVQSVVTSHLDFCKSLLYGLTKSVTSRFLKVRNTAARLVCRAPKHHAVTQLLHQHHWLSIEQRIKFRISLLTH